MCTLLFHFLSDIFIITFVSKAYKIEHNIYQKDIQIWPSSVHENQPCSDAAGLAEDSSSIFPFGHQLWKQDNQHGILLLF